MQPIISIAFVVVAAACFANVHSAIIDLRLFGTDSRDSSPRSAANADGIVRAVHRTVKDVKDTILGNDASGAVLGPNIVTGAVKTVDHVVNGGKNGVAGIVPETVDAVEHVVDGEKDGVVGIVPGTVDAVEHAVNGEKAGVVGIVPVAANAVHDVVNGDTVGAVIGDKDETVPAVVVSTVKDAADGVIDTVNPKVAIVKDIVVRKV